MKTEPKERPINLKSEEVRAILDGRQTQIRRIMKVQPPGEGFQMSRLVESTDRADRKNEGKLHWIKLSENGLRIVDSHNVYFNCPYGNVGDRLWGRETFWQAGDWLKSHPEDDEYKVWSGSCRIFYSADGSPPNEPNRNFPNGLLHGRSAADPHNIWRSRPSINMPRRASRILLEITGVRVKRLNDISEEDAVSEGMFFTDYGRNCFHGPGPVGDVGDCPAPEHTHQQRPGWSHSKTTHQDQCYPSAKWAFVNLWKKINGAESWDLNPWVWVIEFKVLEKNGDN